MTNRVALITGGAGGIGRAIADALIADGICVAAMDLDSEACDSLMHSSAGASKNMLAAFVGDVTRSEDCDRVVKETIEHFGQIDILVNNAGFGVSALRPDAELNHPSIDELTPEIWQKFWNVNVMGAVHLVRAVVNPMKTQGWGRIINNTTSFFTMLRVSPYGATKSALESASAVWAKELEGTGVTVNVLVPGGPTDTAFVGDGIGIPRDKMMQPSVMGPPASWLASADSDGVTGRRFVAGHWDTQLDQAAAAEAAGAPIGWPELGANVVWHGK